jgi:multidrug efflux system membrane fusion protein
MIRINHYFTLLLLIALSSGCQNEVVPEEQIRPVKYARVEQAGGNKERTYAGITRSASLTNLSFRTGGLLLELNAQVGERVRKGSLLARLDQKDAKLAYEQAMVDVQNAKAQFDAASSGFQRAKQLYETNNASLSDYEAAKSSYSSAQSAYEISLKRLDLQQSKIDYTEIIAPMNGIISAVQSEVNEVVQSGRTIIVMSREDNSDMEVEVGLPERYISEIKNGDFVIVRINSINGTFPGLVTEVAYSSSGSGATYPVTVALDIRSNQNIRPDMPAEVTFSFGSAREESFLVAPLKAVGSGVDGNHVFTLETTDEEGIYLAQKVAVELGVITKDGYIIRSGLEEGDLVAVAGLRVLYDGRKVKLLND